MAAEHVLDHLLNHVSAGRRVALCAIVATRGSTPQPAGVVVCVDDAAHMVGTLGGGCVEADLRRQAHQLISAEPRGLKPAAQRSGRGRLITVELDHDFGYDDGMICGGQMDVAVSVLGPSSDLAPYRQAVEQLRAGTAATIPLYVEHTGGLIEYCVHIEAQPTLMIVGAGHISRVLARITLPLGFDLHVLDDRADYANADRFPPPIRTTAGDIVAVLSECPVDPNTYIVIVTRGHKHDEQALRAVLDSPARYVGMIGSRRKIKVIFDDLRHDGATNAQLQRVHAPIGLDINAVTTEEIAVSIAAELVSVRRADSRSVVEGPIPVGSASSPPAQADVKGGG